MRAQVLSELLHEATVQKETALAEAATARKSLSEIRVKQEAELQRLAEQVIQAKIAAGACVVCVCMHGCCCLEKWRQSLKCLCTGLCWFRWWSCAAQLSYEKEGELSRTKNQQKELARDLTSARAHASKAQQVSANMSQRLQAARVEISSSKLEVLALQRAAQRAKRDLYGGKQQASTVDYAGCGNSGSVKERAPSALSNTPTTRSRRRRHSCEGWQTTSLSLRCHDREYGAVPPLRGGGGIGAWCSVFFLFFFLVCGEPPRCVRGLVGVRTHVRTCVWVLWLGHCGTLCVACT